MVLQALVMTSQAGNNMLKRSKNHGGFTLVELLAVIIIIGLLIAVSIPSLARITQANALSNATRQFSDHVAMARTYALVNAQNVYLVMPFSATTGLFGSNYCYTSYGFCASNRTLAGVVTFTYIDEIKHLPSGAIFSDTTSNVASQLFPFPYTNSTPDNVWCMKINPYGQILSPNTADSSQPSLGWRATFFITQGYVNTNSGAAMPIGTYQGTNMIEITPITGKAIVTKS